MSKPKRPELDPIYEASNPLVALPFWGQPVMVRLRELSAAQVYSVGDVSLIETFADKVRIKKIATVEELNSYTERQHKLVKLALVKPTYQEIIDIAGAHIDMAKVDTELKGIREQFYAMPDGPERRELQDKYNTYELQYKFLLPADFIAAVLNYSLKIYDTDIKKITEGLLLDAARMATLGHDNPADHLPGAFTDFNREDINRRAWAEWYKEKDNGRGRR